MEFTPKSMEFDPESAEFDPESADTDPRSLRNGRKAGAARRAREAREIPAAYAADKQ
jgi:hypothetical protein